MIEGPLETRATTILGKATELMLVYADLGRVNASR